MRSAFHSYVCELISVSPDREKRNMICTAFALSQKPTNMSEKEKKNKQQLERHGRAPLSSFSTLCTSDVQTHDVLKSIEEDVKLFRYATVEVACL